MREVKTEWRVPGLTELAVLGSGGQGRVVLASDDESGAKVAIKYLVVGPHAAESARQTFRAEAEMLQRVDNPHIARLLRYVEDDGGSAIVMEAVNGVSLRRVLDDHGALGPEASLVMLKGALLGLAAAHTAGVVHRDFKPANVVVEESGDSKLIDFGIAVLTGQGDRSGTPAYMSPEQWAGQPASPATDLYNATCVFFECVTGRRPYPARDTATLRQQHTEAPVPIEDIPEALRPLVGRGMAKNPAERLWDANGFVTELETVAVESYGPDWERNGRIALAAAAAALSTLFPVAALAGQGLLAKLSAAKAEIGSAAAAMTVVVSLALLMWPEEKAIRPAWDLVGMVPASSISPVDGGFVLYMGRQGGGFEMVSVDGRTGKIRWRKPANFSYRRAASASDYATDKQTVIFLQSVGGARSRLVEVVAADVRTGVPRWRYGSPGIRVIQEPYWCERNRLCLTRRDLETGTEDARILDARTGKEVADSAPVDGRELGGGLYASPDLSQITRITEDGRQVWRRPVRELFGIGRLNLHAGWGVRTDGTRYVVEASGDDAYSEDGKRYFWDRATIAGIDYATGRPLWRDRGARFRCGQLSSTFQRLVRCRSKATETFHGAAPSTHTVDDVTVESFDPVTGKTRWSWHAGPVRGLVVDDGSLLRTGDFTAVVRTRNGLYLLDTAKGARQIDGAPPIGWCIKRGFIQPLQPPAGGEERGYTTYWRWPCDVNGKKARLPSTTPDFAGVRSGDVYAWVDEGGVHAVRVT